MGLLPPLPHRGPGVGESGTGPRAWAGPGPPLGRSSHNPGPDAGYTRAGSALPPTGGVRPHVPLASTHTCCVTRAGLAASLFEHVREVCRLPRGKVMSGVLPDRAGQPQEPDPKTSHCVEDQDLATWPPGGQCESETSYPPASWIPSYTADLRAWQLEGSRIQG